MFLKRFFSVIVTVALVVSVLPVVNAEAKNITDAHGNQIEIDEAKQAYSHVTLNGANNISRKQETNLGDLWTDALLWFAESGEISAYYDEDEITAGNIGIAKDVKGIVALWNGGNLKTDIGEGVFGEEEMMAVLPYPNKVAVIYMTGAELVEALEASSQGLPYSDEKASSCAAFMQIAGAEYIVNTTKAFEAGEAYGKSWNKVKKTGRVTVTSVNGKPFDSKAKYAIITSNANFNGMDSGYVFKDAASKNEESTITSANVRDIVFMYIEKKLSNVIPVAYQNPQGRITVLVEDPASTFVYTVKKGDSLWKIAKMCLGKGKKWEEIFEANKKKISNPKVIYKGQKFVIPGIKAL